MTVIDVIVIHGIGELRKRGQSYSAPLQAKIRKHFGSDADALAFHEVNWSDIGDAEENDLILNHRVLPDASVPGADALWPPQYVAGEVLDSLFNVSEQVRRFLLIGVGDVMVYLTPKGGDLIRQRLIDAILHVRQQALARDPQRTHYVSLIAHSLGSVIAYDVCALLGTKYRDQVAGLGLANMFTMGSPLALFSLLEYGGTPARYSQRGVYLDRPDGEWINFYDQQDPIAFPLRYVYPPQPNTPGRTYTIQDRRVQTGTFHAHTKYFTNDVVAHEIAKRLRREYERL